MSLIISRKEWTNARAAVNTLFTSVSATANVLTMNQTRIRVDTAWEKIDRATEYLGVIETELDIQTRWTPSHPEYVEFHQQTIRTSYSKALDELERLVVMRLFELAKMSTSGIGMSISLCRTYLIKNLQGINFVVRLAEPCNVDRKRFRRPSSDTMPRQSFLIPLVQNCHGQRLSTLVLLVNLIYCATHGRIFSLQTGQSLHIERRHSNTSNYAVQGKNCNVWMWRYSVCEHLSEMRRTTQTQR